MKQILIAICILFLSLSMSGCTNNPSLNSGQSNTILSGKSVMYSQRTF